MPPKTVNLASRHPATRKLTGPPEEYNKQKANQVKDWLTKAKPGQDEAADVAASIASISELGGQLDPAIDELYNDLPESINGDMAPGWQARRRLQTGKESGTPVSKPAKQAPRPVVPAGKEQLSSTNQQTPGKPDGLKPTAVPGVTAPYASLEVASPGQHPGTPSSSSPLGAGAGPSGSPASQTGTVSPSSSGTPSLSPSPAGAAMGSHNNLFSPGSVSSYTGGLPTPGKEPFGGFTGAAAGGDQHKPTGGSRPASAAPPLDFVFDGPLADPLRGALGGGLDSEAERQAVSVAAGLLVARAEAGAAAQAVSGGEVLGEADKYKAALLLAVREKQRLAEEVRVELAAARAAAASAAKDAEQKAAAAAADAALAVKRAATAEAELGKVRAELAKLQQDAKIKRMDAEDREEDHKQEVDRLKAEVAQAVARLQKHGEDRETAMKSAHEEAAQAREVAHSINKQYRYLQRQYDLDKQRLETEVARLQNELRARDTDMARLKAEVDSMRTKLQAEVAARLAAEESEKRALKAAAKQADVAESLAQARQMGTLAKQHAALAAQRVTAVRLGEAAQALGTAPGSRGGPGIEAGKPAGNATATTRPESADNTGKGPAGQASAPGQRGVAAKSKVSPRGLHHTRQSGGAGNDKVRHPLQQEFDEVEIERHHQHRLLSNNLALNKAALEEAKRQQRHAILRVQQHNSQVEEEAIRTAPSYLRCLGLAYRAFMLASPAALAVAGAGAELSTALGKLGYRTFVDPALLTLKPPPLPVVPGLELPLANPMVSISGTVVMLASPGLLTSWEAAAAVSESAERGVPLLILAPPDLVIDQLTQGAAAGSGSPQRTRPSSGQSSTREASQAAQEQPSDPDLPSLTDKAMAWLQAAWSKRITLSSGGSSTDKGSPGRSASPAAAAGPGATSISCLGTPAAMASAMAERLGLTDQELSSLQTKVSHPGSSSLKPLDVLKQLSIGALKGYPNLRTLNAPGLTHLSVTLAPEAQPPGAPEEAGNAPSKGATKGAAPVTGTSGSGNASQARNGAASKTAGGIRLESLLAIIRSNTTITALELQAASISQAVAVAQAVIATPGSHIYSIIAGMDIPVGALLGRPGAPSIREMDLSKGAQDFRPETAAILEACLSAEGAAAQSELTSLSLPPALSDLFNAPQAQQVAQRLAATIVTKLQQLRALNGVPRSAVSAPSPDQQQSSLTLDLSTRALGPIGAAALLRMAAAAQRLGPALQALNLNGCLLAPGGAAELAAAATAAGKLTGLQTAILSDNRIGLEGIPGVCAALAPAAASLLRLDLSLNVLGDEGAKVLARTLASMTSLLTLILSNNAIQMEGARALAGSLPSLKALEDLNLSGNMLGDGGVSALAGAAKSLPALRSLHLQDNHNPGTEAARALGALLSTTTSLQDMRLARSQLGVEGARLLKEGLAVNKSLTHLDLERCNLRSEGVAHIGEALCKNSTLTNLILARNGAGDSGTKSIVTGLESNTSLRSLDLRLNSIGHVGCRMLATVLREKNFILSNLQMAGNDMDEAVLTALEVAAADARVPRRPRVLDVPPTPGGPVASAASAQQPVARQLKQAAREQHQAAVDAPQVHPSQRSSQPQLGRVGGTSQEAATSSTAGGGLSTAAEGLTASSIHSAGAGAGQSGMTNPPAPSGGGQAQVQTGAGRSEGLTSELSERELEAMLARYRVPSGGGGGGLPQTPTRSSHIGSGAGGQLTQGTLWGYTGM